MTLYLVLKGEWFDKIERGEKDNEYREMKPYWEKRIEKFIDSTEKNDVVLSRGYHKNSPKLRADIASIGASWGIDTDLNIDAAVYVIHLRTVRRIA